MAKVVLLSGCLMLVWIADLHGAPPVRNPALAEARPIDDLGRWLMSGRESQQRRKLVATGGGSEASEQAVEAGLKWIIAHQLHDGSWNFDHGKAPKHAGPVNNPGRTQSTTGATALGLLPLLGAGYSHTAGPYQAEVKSGLDYLIKTMKRSDHGGDLRGTGGNMYCHGLAAICLAEAYTMTQDPKLEDPAQQAIKYIVYAQDDVGGGWRYAPKTPGDTSVFGWQMTALWLGKLAKLEIPDKTIAGAKSFLNSVQVDQGAGYGYTTPAQRPATTAIGLLSRLHLGADRSADGFQRGVAYVEQQGPSEDNTYFNFYAAQVMHAVGGDAWQSWNKVMRERLVATQAKQGQATGDRGSWSASQGHTGASGGRLCDTSFNLLTLEIYYRYRPLPANEQ